MKVVVIHGMSGSGKSSLVQEFMKNFPPEVFHVQGKFDQLYSHAPYSALVTASDQLCRQILRNPNCDEISDRIRSVLGPDFPLLGTLIPTLAQLSTSDSDQHQATKEVNIGRSFIRFKQVFRAFLRSVATQVNPLIFFLDDLQWADIASLEVLKSVIHDSLAQNIMIICAYREGEMSLDILQQYHLADENIMVDASISTASGATSLYCAPITDIFIDCLDATQLNELISFKLGMRNHSTQSLSQLIWKKTSGNPFYALNFLDILYKNRLLIAESNDRWIWDESQIMLSTNVSDNLASILESRVQCLAEQIRSILQIASFIGHEFPASILITIVYEEQDTIATDYSFQRQSKQIIRERIVSALAVAVDEGLLETTHHQDEFNFAHDKIQEVLYEALMPDEVERQLLHQRIGTLIWDSVKEMEQSQIDDWFVFLAADNLNRAINLVDYSGDRLYLVELNLNAAKRAIQKSAFLLAADYLRIAVDLIRQSTGCWTESYDLCLELFNTVAETEKNVGCYTRSAEFVEAIHNNAKELHHRSTAFTIEIDILAMQGNIKESVQLGLNVLRTLGIKFPRKFNIVAVLKELLAVKVKLGRRKLQDLSSLPEIEDENILLSLSIMNQIAVNAFILGDVYKEIYVAVCLRMFRFTLSHGISKLHSPLAIVVWGSLNAILGNLNISLEAERLAFHIIDKYNLETIRGATIISSYGFNHFWREKLDSDARNEFLYAYRITMSNGQINVAQLGFLAWVVTALYLDERISDIHPQVRNVLGEMQEYDSKISLIFLLPMWQVLLNFSGDQENDDPSCLRGEALDENFTFSIHEVDSKMALMSLYMMESIVSYVFDDDAGVQRNLEFITKHGNEFQGYFTMGFGQTWLSLFHYERFLSNGKRKHRRLGRQCHRRVKHWADTGTTMLCGPKSLLDAMELLCVLNAPCEALIVSFQDAASACASSHSRLFEGLVYERLAKVLQTHDIHGERHLMYRNRAVKLYRRWGAYTVANYLENKSVQL